MARAVVRGLQTTAQVAEALNKSSQKRPFLGRLHFQEDVMKISKKLLVMAAILASMGNSLAMSDDNFGDCAEEILLKIDPEVGFAKKALSKQIWSTEQMSRTISVLCLHAMVKDFRNTQTDEAINFSDAEIGAELLSSKSANSLALEVIKAKREYWKWQRKIEAAGHQKGAEPAASALKQ